jgi:Tol biopolymer transport system component
MRETRKKIGQKNEKFLFHQIFILLFLVFLAIYPNHVCAESSEQKVTLQQWNNPKEYSVDLDKWGTLFWCGNDELGLLTHKDRNSRTLGFFKNNLETLTTEDTIRIGENETIYGFSCSPDGRYVYFIKTIEYEEYISKYEKNKWVKKRQDLCYYDRNSKSMNTVLSYGAGSGVHDTNTIISPQGKYFIAPAGYSKLTLPGIDNAKVINIDVLLADLPDKWPDNIDKGTKFDLAWDYLDRRIYLLDKDEQTIFLIDPQTLQREKVKVKIDQYEVSEVKTTGNLNKLVLIANNSFDLKSNIYLFDLKNNIYLLDLANKKKPIKLFLSDADYFGISTVGIYVYDKMYGVDRSSPHEVGISLDASKRYLVINLVDDNRNEKNIKKKYWGEDFNDRRASLGHPLISRDGSRITFISVDKINNEKKVKLHLLKNK